MSLHSLLQSQPVVILDGAMGTELERRGITISNTKLWSAKLLVQDPAVLEAIHYDYFRAGADVGTTASYQATVQGLVQEAGISERDAGQLLVKAAELCASARDRFWAEHEEEMRVQEEEEGQAAGGRAAGAGRPRRRQRPLVAFSCGAYGASLADGSEFTGTYADSMTTEQLMAFHRSRLEPVQGHTAIDMLAFETIPCLKEAEAIARLLDTEGLSAPGGAWVSFSCRDGTTTNHGEAFAAECVPLVSRCAAVAAVGVNCTAPAHVAELLQGANAALQSQPRRPTLLCYPNSGEQWNAEGRCWVEAAGGSESAGFASQARTWVQAGATAVGGCCRTTPGHIAALRRELLWEQRQ